MSVENNDCVIATTWNGSSISKIQQWVNSLNLHQKSLFAFLPSISNNMTTVFLAPDGSKEGWPESDRGDELRAEFIKRLEDFKYEDGSNPFSWVEVSYGEYGQKINQGNNSDRYGRCS